MDFTNILLIIVIIGLAILLYVASRSKKDRSDSQALSLLQQQISNLTKQLGEKIDNSTHRSSKLLQDQFIETARITKDVSEKLIKLEETNKQVVSFADQLQQLQDILKNPKGRGILGEYYLETVLKNVLPVGSYQMQYKFKNGDIVDAAIFVKDKVIPVDSKFSLENYNRLAEERNESERSRLEKVFLNDLKTRIVETAKYIRPEEDTMDFAFMFIPHEAIYYDLLVNKIGALQEDDTNNLLQRAASKYKVIIISPTSFLAYLQTVLQGLRALQIEESAKEIRENVEKLQKHIYTYSEYHKKIGTQLSTVANTYNLSSKELKKVDKDILKVSGQGGELEIEELEKPRLE